MSLQRLPPDQAIDKADEPLTPEKSYSKQLLAEGWRKWKEQPGLRLIASTLTAIVIPWLRAGSFWRMFQDTGVWVIATFILTLIFTYVLELFRAPVALDKQKREEIKNLKQKHAQIATTQTQKLTELQTRLDEAQSHKLIFEIDRELHRNKVELEDFSDDDNDHAYRIKAGLKMRFINSDIHPIFVRRISLSLVRDGGQTETLLSETFPIKWKSAPKYENLYFKGLQVPDSTATEDHWFDILVDVPHELNEQLQAGTDLRVTMDASRQKPYFKDLVINWRAAERGPHSIIAFRSTFDRLSDASH
jgi:hypothetical protein